MKRTVSLLLLFLILCLTGCNQISPKTAEPVQQRTESDNTDNKSSENNPNPCIWIQNYYVDEFNDPTGQWYLSATSTGTFNNSAVNNKTLSVRFLLDKSSFSIKLYEYGNIPVKNNGTKNKNYTITVKQSNGNKQTFSGFIPSGDDRIYITSQYLSGKNKDNILRLFQDTNLSFYIEEDEWTTTNYLVAVSTVGLAERYYQLSGEEMPNGLKFSLTESGNEYAITDFGTVVDSTVFIPSQYKGKPVTIIASSAFANCSWLINIDIPDSVEVIDDGAFSGCSSLATISGMKNVQTIGRRAFSGCYSLKSFIIPENCKKIAQEAFYNCNKMEEVFISDSVTSIESSAFYYCSNLECVTLGKSLVNIGYDAFASCPKLKYNTFDNGLYLSSVDNPHFALIQAKDKKISSCQIHPETKIIAGGAFRACTNINSLTIPWSIENIGKNAFLNSTIIMVSFEDDSDWMVESDNQKLLLTSEDFASVYSTALLLYHTYTNFSWHKQSNNISCIQIGVSPDWEPFEYLDNEGNLVGFEIEFAKAIGKIAGIEISFVQISNFDELLPALDNEEFDIVMSGMSYEEARASRYECTNIYFSYAISNDYTMQIVAYARKGNVKLVRLLDNAIAIYKASDEYQQLKEKYGVESLDDRFSD